MVIRYAGKQKIVEKFEELYSVGSDIYTYNLYCVLNDIPEIINVSVFEVEKEIDSNNWATSLIIGKREVTTISITNITIAQNT